MQVEVERLLQCLFRILTACDLCMGFLHWCWAGEHSNLAVVVVGCWLLLLDQSKWLIGADSISKHR